MIDLKRVNQCVEQFMDALPEGVKNLPKDVQENLRSTAQSVFHKMDLVTREEFDAQTGVLLKTRQKLEQLEKQVAELEKQRGKK